LISYHRHIDLANATFDELEQLAQACEPPSVGVNEDTVMDNSYREAGKMAPECFAPLLVPVQTSLVKIIRDYRLEGLSAQNKMKIELQRLNVYSTHLSVI
jgi:hypothetical protein